METKNLEKIKNFILKYKLLVTLVLSTIFIAASAFCYPLVYVAAAILVVGLIFLNFNDILCLLIYSAMFGCILVPFIASTIAAFITIVTKYIIDVKKKRIEFLKWPFAITTFIVAFYSLIHYTVNDLGFYQGLMMIAFLYLIYFVVCYRKQLVFRKYFDFLFYGLIASTLLSILVYFIPGSQTLVFSETGYIMGALKDKVAFIDDNNYVRITLLSFHVNHLSAFCLFAMAYSSIKVLTKKERPLKEKIYYIIMYFANLVVGLLTLSKAFIIVFAFEVFVTIIYYIATHRKQALKIIIFLLAAFGFLVLVFRQRFLDIFERFFVYNYDTLLGMLTTGRSGIWQQYANAILDSPLKLLFGFGLFSQEELLIGPHNFYIFILYRFGILGIMLIAYLVYAYYKSVKTKLDFSIKHCLILLTFLVIGLQEACIDERFYFFIIGFAIMFARENKNDNKTIKSPEAMIIENKKDKGES